MEPIRETAQLHEAVRDGIAVVDAPARAGAAAVFDAVHAILGRLAELHAGQVRQHAQLLAAALLHEELGPVR